MKSFSHIVPPEFLPQIFVVPKKDVILSAAKDLACGTCASARAYQHCDARFFGPCLSE